MIYVFNKNKIFSYIVASFIVLTFFAFSSGLTHNQDTELVQVSTNIVNNTSNNIENNMQESGNNQRNS